MSRSIIAIALCLSVVGMTVVPAGYMPCCCKGARNILGTITVSSPCCQAAVKTEQTATQQSAPHSCCATPKDSPQTTCCGHSQSNTSCLAVKVIEGPCHNCRCIAQMQIVALPGFAVSEKTYRPAEMTAPVAELPSMTPAERWAESLPECGSPGIVITLQTCSFRC
jgi:hypothetical protein